MSVGRLYGKIEENKENLLMGVGESLLFPMVRQVEYY